LKKICLWKTFQKILSSLFLKFFKFYHLHKPTKFDFTTPHTHKIYKLKKHKREAHFSPRVCVFLVKLVERFGKRLKKSVAKIFYLGKVVIRFYLRFKSCLCLRKLAVARLQLLNALDVC